MVLGPLFDLTLVRGSAMVIQDREKTHLSTSDTELQEVGVIPSDFGVDLLCVLSEDV